MENLIYNLKKRKLSIIAVTTAVIVLITIGWFVNILLDSNSNNTEFVVRKSEINLSTNAFLKPTLFNKANNIQNEVEQPPKAVWGLHDPKLTIYGFTQSIETKSPISGVKVIAQIPGYGILNNTISDKNGYYELTFPVTGDGHLVVDFNGVIIEEPLSSFPSSTGKFKHDFYIADSKLKVSVTDETNNPLSEVTVMAYESGVISGPSSAERIQITDENGQAVLSALGYGLWVIEASSKYGVAKEKVLWTADHKPESVNLKIKKGCSVKINLPESNVETTIAVLNRDGSKVRYVDLNQIQNKSMEIVGSFNGNERFLFAEDPFLGQQIQEVKCNGGIYNFDFPNKTSFTIEVKNEDEHEVNAHVFLVSAGYEKFVGATDEYGRINLPGIAFNGQPAVHAEKNGFKSKSVILWPDSNETISLNLIPTWNMNVNATDSLNFPAVGLKIRLTKDGHMLSCQTDSDGGCEIKGLYEGEWYAFADTDNRYNDWKSTVYIQNDEQQLDIKMPERGFTLKGNIAPAVPGIQVSLLGCNKHSRIDTSTDVYGNWILNNLKKGTYSLKASLGKFSVLKDLNSVDDDLNLGTLLLSEQRKIVFNLPDESIDNIIVKHSVIKPCNKQSGPSPLKYTKQNDHSISMTATPETQKIIAIAWKKGKMFTAEWNNGMVESTVNMKLQDINELVAEK